MEVLEHIPWWVWLLVSAVPYSIKRQQTPHMQLFTLSALFWQFSFTCQKRQCAWSFSLPWIVQIQQSRYLRTMGIKAVTKLIREWVKKSLSL